LKLIITILLKEEKYKPRKIVVLFISFEGMTPTRKL